MKDDWKGAHLSLMRLTHIAQILFTAATVAAFVYAMRTRQPSGRILEVPYEFRVPTSESVRKRLWNPDDPRLFTPPILGVGWSINLFQAAVRAQALLALATERRGDT